MMTIFKFERLQLVTALLGPKAIYEPHDPATESGW